MRGLSSDTQKPMPMLEVLMAQTGAASPVANHERRSVPRTAGNERHMKSGGRRAGRAAVANVIYCCPGAGSAGDDRRQSVPTLQTHVIGELNASSVASPSETGCCCSAASASRSRRSSQGAKRAQVGPPSGRIPPVARGRSCGAQRSNGGLGQQGHAAVPVRDQGVAHFNTQVGRPTSTPQVRSASVPRPKHPCI